MTYAVIATGGKQYKVTTGDIITIDRISSDTDTITFDNVLLFVDGDNTKIGSPVLSNVVVTGKILEQMRGKKVRVAKFKAKAKYRRNAGFRAALTKVQIESLALKNELNK